METFTKSLNQIQTLLLEKKRVALDDIPELFKEDILKFHLGSTICFDDNNRPCFHPWDFKDWFNKVATEGLNYPINVSI